MRLRNIGGAAAALFVATAVQPTQAQVTVSQFDRCTQLYKTVRQHTRDLFTHDGYSGQWTQQDLGKYSAIKSKNRIQNGEAHAVFPVMGAIIFGPMAVSTDKQVRNECTIDPAGAMHFLASYSHRYGWTVPKGP